MPDAAARLCGCCVALALAGCGVAQPTADVSQTGDNAGNEPFRAVLKQADEAAQDGDLAEAGALLDQARGLEPDSPALWVAIARLRFRGGEHLQALEAANRALELGPSYAPALVLRAQLVRDAYGLSDALIWFEAAVEADPNNTQALAEYAATLGDAGYHTEMLAVTRALADIVPKEPRVLYLKAVLAARAGQPVLAKSLVERSGLAESGVPAAMMLDALIDLQERNYDSAAERLEALARKQPGNTRVKELLARALWLGNRDAELVAQFKQAANREETSPYLVMLVARSLERQGKRAEAAPLLERAYAGRELGWVALSQDTGLPRPTFEMRGLIGAGRVREARKSARRLRERLGGSSDIAVLSGDAAMASGDYASALEHYREAARVRRPWPLTLKAAEAYRAFGDPIAADVLLARHLVGEPRNTEALWLNAQRAARAEDWLRVAVLLDNAIDLGAGNDPKLLELRGRAARALGEETQAQRFERMAWELHPELVPPS